MQVRYQAAPHTVTLNSSSRYEPDLRAVLLRIEQRGDIQKILP